MTGERPTIGERPMTVDRDENGNAMRISSVGTTEPLSNVPAQELFRGIVTSSPPHIAVSATGAIFLGTFNDGRR